MKKITQTTTTKLIMEALRAADDFMDYAMLLKATGRNRDQVSAACFILREYAAVDVVIGPQGKAWWFALPEESDKRQRTVAECQVGITKPNRKAPKNKRRKKKNTP